ncbi:MAG: ATP-binding cassette domain-containing protein [Deltaproteobacteria bacterium]|nr:ATP-binding cassette domain-containing protein [Deltaproteobacteria bacterium]
MENGIQFSDLYKSFGEKSVLTGVTMGVGRGEVLFVIGTSGVGKSVTIKHIIGLLKPTSGTVTVDGVHVEKLGESQLLPIRKKVAMVFQASSLFDSLSILENVMLPIKKHLRMSESKIRDKAMGLLKEVGMESYAHIFPAEIGDGMRKRVAIARALTLDPDYVLFDEPTTGLDPVSARRVDSLISSLAAKHNAGCIVVSHDLTSIFTVATRIAMIYKGTVYKEGLIEEFRESQDPVIKQFLSGTSTGPMETPGF